MTEQEKPEETPEESAAPPSAGGAAGRGGGGSGGKRGGAPAGPPTAVLAPGGEPGLALVPRRRILQVGFWAGIGASVAAAGACGVDLLYPRGVTGFGGRVTLDQNGLPPPGGKAKIDRGRFWLVNLTEEQGGPGLLALWWKCPPLGGTVPWRE